MKQIRPYKPAPKNASANRIRERYLHQLGLQRGVGAPLAAPQSNHVVVISGLPSLPEDRATTEHVMECHDFSISSKVSRHSQHTGATQSSGENDEMSDSGSAQKQDVHSLCSKSTLSASPSLTSGEAGEALTSLALAYPTALRKIPAPEMPIPPPSGNSSPFPWRTALSKPATVLLDSAEYRCNDHDSVSTEVTSTTAESSLTAMVSRDWGAVPHSASASQGGESPASTPGVYFQCGRTHLLGSNVNVCPTSSLSHALHRFNIDSDCEASVASNSIVEDHMMMDEDDASSVASHASASSSKSQLSSASHHSRIRAGARKKIGKNQRLMERAVAHERILQIRSDRSQTMRANLVHSQRMSNPAPASGLSSAMNGETPHLILSESPRSTSSSPASMPLLHVQHGSRSSQASVSQPPLALDGTSQILPPPHAPGDIDLGRTPTASNCSEMRRLAREMGPPSLYLPSLPVGVHMTTNRKGEMVPPNLRGGQGDGAQTTSAPLVFHPQLASRIPTPPPKLVAQGMTDTQDDRISTADQASSTISKPSLIQVDSREAGNSTSSSLEHTDHDQATVDEVMEVAMTLSRLGGRGHKTGPVPRIR